MKEINLGRILVENRHKRGITQDELAAYMGVSKAAVSKWETGTTYPDITLLPQLATFFNLSIDEIMGYEPQLTKEDIRKLYRQLSADFASQPLDTVLAHCREITKKYYSCFPLLYQIGSLLVNHCSLAESPEKADEILEEARKLFIRVKTQSDDIELGKQALNMEALCLLTLKRPEDVLSLLEGSESLWITPEPLLASAYQMLGKTAEAKQIFQTGIYQYLVGLFNLLPAYMNLCQDDPDTFEETCRRTLAISDAFQIQKLHPSLLLSFFIVSAQGFSNLGNKEKALEMLEQYTRLATGNIYPLKLHGDGYFSLLDEWLENTLVLGDDPPREEAVIRRSMTQAVIENPAFLSFSDEPRFASLIQQLKANEEGFYANRNH